MKFFVLIIFLLKFAMIYNGLLKNSLVRTGMQSLACNLFRKYDDLKKLDENFIKIAKDNTKHNSLSIESSEYSALLSKLKSYDELGKQYLVYKMLFGDKLAWKFFIDIKNTKKEKQAKLQLKVEVKIDEKKVLERIRRIIDLTNGIGAGNYATFQAVEYLENFKLGADLSRCKPNLFTKAQMFFIEKSLNRVEMKYTDRMESLSKDVLQGWIGIKFYKLPKNAFVTDEAYWKKPGENFPNVIEYGKTESGKACIFQDKEVIMVDSIENVQKKEKCDVQIVSPATEDTRESEIVPINISYLRTQDKFNVKFYVSENKLDYNCIGWSIGMQDFLNTNIYNEKSQEVRTKDELILYLLQFAEALKYIGKNNNFKKTYNLILLKKKPAPSLINSLLSTETPREFLDGQLTGLNNGIKQEDIEKLCQGDFNGAVIFYGQNDKMTHGARYIGELKLWTSKLGQSYLVTHNLELMSDSPTEKSLYGFPKFLYCPNGVTKSDVLGANPGRIDFS